MKTIFLPSKSQRGKVGALFIVTPIEREIRKRNRTQVNTEMAIREFEYSWMEGCSDYSTPPNHNATTVTTHFDLGTGTGTRMESMDITVITHWNLIIMCIRLNSF